MKKIFYTFVIIASMVLVSSCGNRKTVSEDAKVDTTETVTATVDTTETVTTDTVAVATTAE